MTKHDNFKSIGKDVGHIEYAVAEAVIGTKGAGLVAKGVKTAAELAIGAERLALIAAKSAEVLEKIKFGLRGVVRIGTRLKPGMASFEDFVKSIKGLSEGENAALARQAHELYAQQKWGELEELFNKNGLNDGYPPNNGFVSSGSKTLQPGERFDRYGGFYKDGKFMDEGKFASPEGASDASRALPESSLKKPKNTYEVVKPITNVQEGKAIPWFGQEGMGTQYKFPQANGIQDLIDGGYIKKIP